MKGNIWVLHFEYHIMTVTLLSWPSFLSMAEQGLWQVEKMLHINGLMQERCNSIANTLESSLSCTNPLICNFSLWLRPCSAIDRKLALGWGLLRRFPPFRYFPNFSTSPKYVLAIEYHVHIWQVSPQLSCGDTCQIWIRFKECNRYFCQI